MKINNPPYIDYTNSTTHNTVRVPVSVVLNNPSLTDTMMNASATINGEHTFYRFEGEDTVSRKDFLNALSAGGQS